MRKTKLKITLALSNKTTALRVASLLETLASSVNVPEAESRELLRLLQGSCTVDAVSVEEKL